MLVNKNNKKIGCSFKKNKAKQNRLFLTPAAQKK